METRKKTNAEFRSEVNEILAQHKSSFNQVNSALQAILTELQSLRISRSPHKADTELNPFAPGEFSHRPNQSYFNNRSHHHLKLSFPKFNGEDPTGWVYKAEQYFDFKSIAIDQQVQLASFHLEGIALLWQRWFTKFKGPMTWDEFTQAVLQRFGPIDFEDHSEALTRLKQSTTLSHRVDGLLEKFLVGCFIAGIKEEIRLDVKIKQLSTLADTIGVARLIEERNQL
ncbi:hypothetical protein ACOSP7_022892 [Xanthoceras sorbifolium]